MPFIGQCSVCRNPNIRIENGVLKEHKKKGRSIYGSKVCEGSGKPPVEK